MSPHNNENYNAWAARVEMFEKARALKHIAKGINLDIVLDEMSYRIIAKLLYPIFNSIKNSTRYVNVEQFEKDKIAYYEKMKYKGKAADHVDPNS